MKLKYISPEYKTEWENLVKSNPSSGFMQSFFWTDLKQLLGWETYKIGIFEKNKLIGGAVIGKFSHFKKISFLAIPEGPVLPYEKKDSEKMFDLLISEIDQIANLNEGKLSSHLSIEPKLEKTPPYFKRFKKAALDNQPIKTLLIDLSLSEDKILRQMKPKGRYNIKVAQKNNVEIYKETLSEGINNFVGLYKEFTKAHKIKPKDDSYFESLAKVVPNKNAEIYFAKKGKSILSSAIIIYFGDSATFLYGASSENHKNLMASYLMQFEIIKNAKKLGYKWYDLYALSPDEKDVTHPWYGFSVFKRKFGGIEKNFIGGYDFIYNKKLYKEYERLSSSE